MLQPRFYEATRANWDQSMNLTYGWPSGYTALPENWAKGIVTGVPGGEITGFYLSFRGGGATSSATPPLAGNNFLEPVNAPIGGNWQSSPMDQPVTGAGATYSQAYKKRTKCSSLGYSTTTGHGYCHLGKFPCGDI